MSRILAGPRVGMLGMLFTLILASASIGLQPSAIASEFPFADPIEATMTSAVLKARDSSVFESFELTALQSGRDQIPYVEGRNSITLRFALAAPDAPLIFIVPGVGGDAYSAPSSFLADRLHEAGYNVLLLPSPLDWRFALTASRSGLPGATTEDSEDLYQVMQLGLRQLQAARGLRPRSLGLVGYSLGAFEGAFLALIDGARQELGIRKFLLINPPVDLTYAMRTLDGMKALGMGLGSDRVDWILGTAMNWGGDLLEHDISDPMAYFAGASLAMPNLNPTEKRFLIGASLSECITNDVIVSQSIHDEGILNGPADEAHGTRRFAQAKRVSFGDYYSKFVLPEWLGRHGLAPGSAAAQRAVRAELSLQSHQTELRMLAAQSRVYLMHNENDFLVRPEELALLKQTFGGQAAFYSYGGHVGNLWFPANLSAMLSVFSAL